MKVIFLDRDGVINNNAKHYYVYKPENFELNKGVVKSLKKFVEKGYEIIVISNQGGISKGVYTKQDLNILDDYMRNIFSQENIIFKETYYCPHHSDLEKCICRKPNSLLIEKAIARFKIDTKNSIMIGDSDRDIKAAKKTGLQTLKVKANADLFEEIKKSEFSDLVL